MPWDPYPKAVPKGFAEIQRAESEKMFGAVVGARVVVAPLVGLAALVLAIWEPSSWRRGFLLTAAVGVTLVSITEIRRFRRRGLEPRSIPFNIGLGVCGLSVITLATGGVESPALPLMVMLSLFNGVFIVRRRTTLALAAVQIGAIWLGACAAIFELVPDFNMAVFGGGRRAGLTDAHLATFASLATLAVVAATAVGRKQRHIFDNMLVRALAARDDALALHHERTAELTALSGEIAHELKNPMASAKGLAALLARDLPEGKPAERLGVLRRELDRMQGTLDEFLNFSRPLSPLSLEPVDLGALSREVAALHEGMAREKGASVGASGRGSVRCDPRKVKQVLINLVQNALDASPGGAEVQIRVEDAPGGALVEVLDRGPGIDPAVEDRLFQPGATTKAKGTGLGLTIARSLARQHGGELTLAGREGGGCAARLTLPAEPRASPGHDGGAP